MTLLLAQIVGIFWIAWKPNSTSAEMPLPDGEEPSRRDVVMITAGGFAGIALWPLLDQMNPD